MNLTHNVCGYPKAIDIDKLEDVHPDITLYCDRCEELRPAGEYSEVKDVVDVDSLEECFPILEYFKCGHLPQTLQDVSMPFGVLAFDVARRWHAKHEDAKTFEQTELALTCLLQAKDAAVRASL